MVVTTQYVRQLSYICPVARHPVPAVTIWDLELEGLRRSARREGPSLGGGPPACGQAGPFLTSPAHAREEQR
jgi:hypothetical protein